MIKLIVNESNDKQEKKELRTAIQVLHKRNPTWSDTKIAKELKINRKYVAFWKDRSSCENLKKNKKSKKTKKITKYLKKIARNKLTGNDNASSRKVQLKLRKKFKLKISQSTANRWLNQDIGEPRKSMKNRVML